MITTPENLDTSYFMCRLAQVNSHVHDLGLALHVNRESTFLEYFQHRDIIRQDLSVSSLRPAAWAIAAR